MHSYTYTYHQNSACNTYTYIHLFRTALIQTTHTLLERARLGLTTKLLVCASGSVGDHLDDADGDVSPSFRVCVSQVKYLSVLPRHIVNGLHHRLY